MSSETFSIELRSDQVAFARLNAAVAGMELEGYLAWVIRMHLQSVRQAIEGAHNFEAGKQSEPHR